MKARALAGSRSRIAWTSTPAEKARPAPPSTTTRTSGSRPSSRKVPPSPAISAAFRRLSGGRSSVTRATPAPRSTRSSAMSVAAEGAIDGERPGVDAAPEVHRGEALPAQPLDHRGGADAMVAVDDRLARRIQLVRPQRQLVHRDQPRAGERADLILPRLPNVEERGSVSVVQARLQRLRRDLGAGVHARFSPPPPPPPPTPG